jgi:succinate-acetate transporter protein
MKQQQKGRGVTFIVLFAIIVGTVAFILFLQSLPSFVAVNLTIVFIILGFIMFVAWRARPNHNLIMGGSVRAVFCSTCGEINLHGSKFCNTCGKELA